MYVNQLTNETYIQKGSQNKSRNFQFQQIIKKEDYLFYQRTTICQLWDTE